MKCLRNLFILSCCVWLAGCTHYFRGFFAFLPNHKYDYAKSKNGPDLVVPPTMSQKKISDYYLIPKVRGRVGGSLVPPGSGLQQAKMANPISPQEVKYAKEKGTLALVVNEPFNRTWSAARSGLRRRNLPITKAPRQLRVMYFQDTTVTGDKAIKASPLYQLHFRVVNNKSTALTLADQHGRRVSNKDAKRIFANLERGMEGHSKTTFTQALLEHIV